MIPGFELIDPIPHLEASSRETAVTFSLVPKKSASKPAYQGRGAKSVILWQSG